SIISGPSHGNLTGSNATLTYTPDGNFSDTDSFTFVASDGTNNSTEATVSITINAVNDAPVANNQSLSTDEDTPLPITLNATDAEGSPLTFILVTLPEDGAISGTVPNLTYTPKADFFGTDELTFTADDGGDATGNTATISITVNSVNDLPVADAGADQSAPENVTVTLDGSASSDVETDSSSLTYSWTQTAGPSVTLSNPNSTTPAFTGPSSSVTSGTTVLTFQLVVNDGIADSAPDTVNVTVLATSSSNDDDDDEEEDDDDDDDDRSRRRSGGGGGGSGPPVNLSVYPPSHFKDRPLDRVQILGSLFYRQDNPDVSVTYAFEGSTLAISTTLKNYQNVEQQLTVIVQVSDDKGSTVHVGTIDVTLGSGQTTTVSMPWTVPSQSSSSYYTVKVLVWSSMESNPAALAVPYHAVISII
ncbi:MAG TPA: tandem-95 repeat protein, partial [Nitrososphaera sp.]